MTYMPYDPDPTGVENLGQLMTHVLSSIENVFEQADVPLPDRRYVTFGGTAHDCEQLTVSFIQMYLGPPGDVAAEPQRCNAPRSALLAIELVRCLPVGPRGSAPSAAQATEHAIKQAVDAWLLVDGAAQQAFDPWGLGILADVTVTEPAGAYQAVVLNLTVAVP